SISYKHYGGRGIGVCDEWRFSAESFYRDMGEPRGLTLDRIDNDKGYQKDNCRWATQEEQARNKRNTVHVEINGRVQALKQWAQETGLAYSMLYDRYKVQGIRGQALLLPSGQLLSKTRREM